MMVEAKDPASVRVYGLKCHPLHCVIVKLVDDIRL